MNPPPQMHLRILVEIAKLAFASHKDAPRAGLPAPLKGLFKSQDELDRFRFWLFPQLPAMPSIQPGDFARVKFSLLTGEPGPWLRVREVDVNRGLVTMYGDMAWYHQDQVQLRISPCSACQERSGPPEPLSSQEEGNLEAEYGRDAVERFRRHVDGVCYDDPQ